MVKCRNFLKIIAFITLIFFLLTDLSQNAVYAYEVALKVNPQAQPLWVRPSIGKIVTSTSQSSNSPKIIHILDAHSEPGAQRSIKELVLDVAQQRKIKHIFVEGYEGEIKTPWLQKAIQQTEQKESPVIEWYIENGYLTGGEAAYLSNPSLKLHGIESSQLYEKNLSLLKEILEKNQHYSERMKVLKKNVKALFRRESNSKLWNFWKEYQGKELTVADFEIVQNLANSFKDVFKLRPDQLKSKLKEGGMDSLEKIIPYVEALDFNRLEEELNEILNAIEIELEDQPEVLSRYEKELVQIRLKKQDSKSSFFEWLQLWAVFVGLKKEKYVQWQLYSEFLNLTQTQQFVSFDSDLKKIYQMIWFQLSSSNKDKDWHQRHQWIQLLEKSTHLKLSSEEYFQFKNTFIQLQFNSLEFLKEAQSWIDWDLLDQFYLIAMQRDESIVINLEKQLKDQGIKEAILITGGFHQPGIQKQAGLKDMNYVAISPKFKSQHNYQLYHKRIENEFHSDLTSITKDSLSESKNLQKNTEKLLQKEQSHTPLKSGEYLESKLNFNSKDKLVSAHLIKDVNRLAAGIESEKYERLKKLITICRKADRSQFNELWKKHRSFFLHSRELNFYLTQESPEFKIFTLFLAAYQNSSGEQEELELLRTLLKKQRRDEEDLVGRLLDKNVLKIINERGFQILQNLTEYEKESTAIYQWSSIKKEVEGYQLRKLLKGKKHRKSILAHLEDMNEFNVDGMLKVWLNGAYSSSTVVPRLKLARPDFQEEFYWALSKLALLEIPTEELSETGTWLDKVDSRWVNRLINKVLQLPSKVLDTGAEDLEELNKVLRSNYSMEVSSVRTARNEALLTSVFQQFYGMFPVAVLHSKKIKKVKVGVSRDLLSELFPEGDVQGFYLTTEGVEDGTIVIADGLNFEDWIQTLFEEHGHFLEEVDSDKEIQDYLKLHPEHRDLTHEIGRFLTAYLKGEKIEDISEEAEFKELLFNFFENLGFVPQVDTFKAFEKNVINWTETAEAEEYVYDVKQELELREIVLSNKEVAYQFNDRYRLLVPALQNYLKGDRVQRREVLKAIEKIPAVHVNILPEQFKIKFEKEITLRLIHIATHDDHRTTHPNPRDVARDELFTLWKGRGPDSVTTDIIADHSSNNIPTWSIRNKPREYAQKFLLELWMREGSQKRMSRLIDIKTMNRSSPWRLDKISLKEWESLAEKNKNPWWKYILTLPLSLLTNASFLIWGISSFLITTFFVLVKMIPLIVQHLFVAFVFSPSIAFRGFFFENTPKHLTSNKDYGPFYGLPALLSLGGSVILAHPYFALLNLTSLATWGLSILFGIIGAITLSFIVFFLSQLIISELLMSLDEKQFSGKFFKFIKYISSEEFMLNTFPKVKDSWKDRFLPLPGLVYAVGFYRSTYIDTMLGSHIRGFNYASQFNDLSPEVLRKYKDDVEESLKQISVSEFLLLKEHVIDLYLEAIMATLISRAHMNNSRTDEKNYAEYFIFELWKNKKYFDRVTDLMGDSKLRPTTWGSSQIKLPNVNSLMTFYPQKAFLEVIKLEGRFQRITKLISSNGYSLDLFSLKDLAIIYGKYRAGLPRKIIQSVFLVSTSLFYLFSSFLYHSILIPILILKLIPALIVGIFVFMSAVPAFVRFYFNDDRTSYEDLKAPAFIIGVIQMIVGGVVGAKITLGTLFGVQLAFWAKIALGSLSFLVGSSLLVLFVMFGMYLFLKFLDEPYFQSGISNNLSKLIEKPFFYEGFYKVPTSFKSLFLPLKYLNFVSPYKTDIYRNAISSKIENSRLSASDMNDLPGAVRKDMRSKIASRIWLDFTLGQILNLNKDVKREFEEEVTRRLIQLSETQGGHIAHDSRVELLRFWLERGAESKVTQVIAYENDVKIGLWGSFRVSSDLISEFTIAVNGGDVEPLRVVYELMKKEGLKRPISRLVDKKSWSFENILSLQEIEKLYLSKQVSFLKKMLFFILKLPLEIIRIVRGVLGFVVDLVPAFVSLGFILLYTIFLAALSPGYTVNKLIDRGPELGFSDLLSLIVFVSEWLLLASLLNGKINIALLTANPIGFIALIAVILVVTAVLEKVFSDHNYRNDVVEDLIFSSEVPGNILKYFFVERLFNKNFSWFKGWRDVLSPYQSKQIQKALIKRISETNLAVNLNGLNKKSRKVFKSAVAEAVYKTIEVRESDKLSPELKKEHEEALVRGYLYHRKITQLINFWEKQGVESKIPSILISEHNNIGLSDLINFMDIDTQRTLLRIWAEAEDGRGITELMDLVQWNFSDEISLEDLKIIFQKQKTSFFESVWTNSMKFMLYPFTFMLGGLKVLIILLPLIAGFFEILLGSIFNLIWSAFSLAKLMLISVFRVPYSVTALAITQLFFGKDSGGEGWDVRVWGVIKMAGFLTSLSILSYGAMFYFGLGLVKSYLLMAGASWNLMSLAVADAFIVFGGITFILSALYGVDRLLFKGHVFKKMKEWNVDVFILNYPTRPSFFVFGNAAKKIGLPYNLKFLPAEESFEYWNRRSHGHLSNMVKKRVGNLSLSEVNDLPMEVVEVFYYELKDHLKDWNYYTLIELTKEKKEKFLNFLFALLIERLQTEESYSDTLIKVYSDLLKVLDEPSVLINKLEESRAFLIGSEEARNLWKTAHRLTPLKDYFEILKENQEVPAGLDVIFSISDFFRVVFMAPIALLYVLIAFPLEFIRVFFEIITVNRVSVPWTTPIINISVGVIAFIYSLALLPFQRLGLIVVNILTGFRFNSKLVFYDLLFQREIVYKYLSAQNYRKRYSLKEILFREENVKNSARFIYSTKSPDAYIRGLIKDKSTTAELNEFGILDPSELKVVEPSFKYRLKNEWSLEQIQKLPIGILTRYFDEIIEKYLEVINESPNDVAVKNFVYQSLLQMWLHGDIRVEDLFKDKTFDVGYYTYDQLIELYKSYSQPTEYIINEVEKLLQSRMNHDMLLRMTPGMKRDFHDLIVAEIRVMSLQEIIRISPEDQERYKGIVLERIITLAKTGDLAAVAYLTAKILKKDAFVLKALESITSIDVSYDAYSDVIKYFEASSGRIPFVVTSLKKKIMREPSTRVLSGEDVDKVLPKEIRDVFKAEIVAVLEAQLTRIGKVNSGKYSFAQMELIRLALSGSEKSVEILKKIPYKHKSFATLVRLIAVPTLRDYEWIGEDEEGDEYEFTVEEEINNTRLFMIDSDVTYLIEESGYDPLKFIDALWAEYKNPRSNQYTLDKSDINFLYKYLSQEESFVDDKLMAVRLLSHILKEPKWANEIGPSIDWLLSKLDQNKNNELGAAILNTLVEFGQQQHLSSVLKPYQEKIVKVYERRYLTSRSLKRKVERFASNEGDRLNLMVAVLGPEKLQENELAQFLDAFEYIRTDKNQSMIVSLIVEMVEKNILYFGDDKGKLSVRKFSPHRFIKALGEIGTKDAFIILEEIVEKSEKWKVRLGAYIELRDNNVDLNGATLKVLRSRERNKVKRSIAKERSKYKPVDLLRIYNNPKTSPIIMAEIRAIVFGDNLHEPNIRRSYKDVLERFGSEKLTEKGEVYLFELVQGIVHVNHPDWALTLLNMYEQLTNVDLKKEILNLVANARPSGADRTLRNLLRKALIESSINEELLSVLIEVNGRLANESSEKFIIEIFKDEKISANLRQKALEALGKISSTVEVMKVINDVFDKSLYRYVAEQIKLSAIDGIRYRASQNISDSEKAFEVAEWIMKQLKKEKVLEAVIEDDRSKAKRRIKRSLIEVVFGKQYRNNILELLFSYPKTKYRAIYRRLNTGRLYHGAAPEGTLNEEDVFPKGQWLIRSVTGTEAFLDGITRGLQPPITDRKARNQGKSDVRYIANEYDYVIREGGGGYGAGSQQFIDYNGALFLIPSEYYNEAKITRGIDFGHRKLPVIPFKGLIPVSQLGVVFIKQEHFQQLKAIKEQLMDDRGEVITSLRASDFFDKSSGRFGVGERKMSPAELDHFRLIDESEIYEEVIRNQNPFENGMGILVGVHSNEDNHSFVDALNRIIRRGELNGVALDQAKKDEISHFFRETPNSDIAETTFLSKLADYFNEDGKIKITSWMYMLIQGHELSEDLTGTTPWGPFGSNKARFMKRKSNGDEYYVKFYPEINQLRTEYVAWRMAKELGVNVPTDVRIIKMTHPGTGSTEYAIASKRIPGLIEKFPEGSDEQLRKSNEVLERFLFDMITLNYDGRAKQNNGIDNSVRLNGNPVVWDFGGSFHYRARGTLKNEGFNIQAIKDFMGDPTDITKPGTYASVAITDYEREFFGFIQTELGRAAQKRMAKKIAKLTDRQIKQIVYSAGFESKSDETVANNIITTLKEARAYVKEIYQLSDVEGSRQVKKMLETDDVTFRLNIKKIFKYLPPPLLSLMERPAGRRGKDGRGRPLALDIQQHTQNVLKGVDTDGFNSINIPGMNPRALIRAAALMHDVGKATITADKKTERALYDEQHLLHEEKSIEFAYQFLPSLGFSNDEIKIVEAILIADQFGDMFKHHANPKPRTPQDLVDNAFTPSEELKDKLNRRDLFRMAFALYKADIINDGAGSLYRMHIEPARKSLDGKPHFKGLYKERKVYPKAKVIYDLVELLEKKEFEELIKTQFVATMLDIDGTLTLEHGKLSKKAIELLVKLLKGKVFVSFATARLASKPEMKKVYEALRTSGMDDEDARYLIVYADNGAEILDGFGNLVRQPKRLWPGNYSFRRGEQDVKGVLKTMGIVLKQAKSEKELTEKNHAFLQKRKNYFRLHFRDIRNALPYVTRLQAALVTDGIPFTAMISGRRSIDFMPLGTDKASSLEDFVEHIERETGVSVHVNEILKIGDQGEFYGNDYSYLQFNGISVGKKNREHVYPLAYINDKGKRVMGEKATMEIMVKAKYRALPIIRERAELVPDQITFEDFKQSLDKHQSEIRGTYFVRPEDKIRFVLNYLERTSLVYRALKIIADEKMLVDPNKGLRSTEDIVELLKTTKLKLSDLEREKLEYILEYFVFAIFGNLNVSVYAKAPEVIREDIKDAIVSVVLPKVSRRIEKTVLSMSPLAQIFSIGKKTHWHVIEEAFEERIYLNDGKKRVVHYDGEKNYFVLDIYDSEEAQTPVKQIPILALRTSFNPLYRSLLITKTQFELLTAEEKEQLLLHEAVEEYVEVEESDRVSKYIRVKLEEVLTGNLHSERILSYYDISIKNIKSSHELAEIFEKIATFLGNPNLYEREPKNVVISDLDQKTNLISILLGGIPTVASSMEDLYDYLNQRIQVKGLEQFIDEIRMLSEQLDEGESLKQKIELKILENTILNMDLEEEFSISKVLKRVQEVIKGIDVESIKGKLENVGDEDPLKDVFQLLGAGLTAVFSEEALSASSLGEKGSRVENLFFDALRLEEEKYLIIKASVWNDLLRNSEVEEVVGVQQFLSLANSQIIIIKDEKVVLQADYVNNQQFKFVDRDLESLLKQLKNSLGKNRTFYPIINYSNSGSADRSDNHIVLERSPFALMASLSLLLDQGKNREGYFSKESGRYRVRLEEFTKHLFKNAMAQYLIQIAA